MARLPSLFSLLLVVSATNAVYAYPPDSCPWEIRGTWKGVEVGGAADVVDYTPLALVWDDALSGYAGTSGPRRVEYLWDAAAAVWSGQYRLNDASAWVPLSVPVAQFDLIGKSLYDPVTLSRGNFLVVELVDWGVGKHPAATWPYVAAGFAFGCGIFFIINIFGFMVRLPEQAEHF